MPLDGQVVVGERVTFTNKGQVVIGDRTLALADCDWIEPGDGSGVTLPGVAHKRLGVWLVDGSWLPVTTIVAGDKDHEVSLSGPLGNISLPLTAIRGWGIGVELIGQDSKDDQIILESGLLTGRIEGLVSGKIIFKSPLDPNKPLEIALGQIRGLRLAVPIRAAKGVRLAVSMDDSHPPVRIMTTATGMNLYAVPAIDVTQALTPMRLRIEGGRRVYLSDLEPNLREETGAFGVVWPYQRNKNLDGSPLRLGGVRYEQGLSIHSQARLGWNLNGAYSRLRATIGIADLVANQGDCAASLLVDDKVVWTRDSVRGGERPQIIDLDLAGAKRLEVRVDYGARYDIADHLVLADAFLIMAK